MVSFWSEVLGLFAPVFDVFFGCFSATRPDCPEYPTTASFEATFSMASEQVALFPLLFLLCLSFVWHLSQAGKLRLGKNKIITAFFGRTMLIHVNYMPIVLSFIANSDANAGLLLGLVPELKTALETIRQTVSSEESAQ